MAVEDIEKLAEQFQVAHPEVADLLRVTANVARKLSSSESLVGEFSLEELEKANPEFSFAEEHKRQSLILANCFAKKLGMTKEEYIASLPQFPARPKTYTDLGLTLPLIVETRLPWRVAAEISRIGIEWISKDDDKIKDWDSYNMPVAPFSAWVQDGTKFSSMRPKEVREKLSLPEYREYRCGRLFDAISFVNIYPKMASKLHWDIIGNIVGRDNLYTPFIKHIFECQFFDANNINCVEFPSAALVLGRKIRTAI